MKESTFLIFLFASVALVMAQASSSVMMKSGDSTPVGSAILKLLAISPISSPSQQPAAYFELLYPSGASIDRFSLPAGSAYGKNGFSFSVLEIFIGQGDNSYVRISSSTHASGEWGIATGKRVYSLGEGIEITVTGPVTGCAPELGGLEFYGPTGNRLFPEPPGTMHPAICKVMGASGAVTLSWNQIYYDAGGNALKIGAGAYSVKYGGAKTEFQVTGETAPPDDLQPPAPPESEGKVITLQLNAGWNLFSVPIVFGKVYCIESGCAVGLPGNPAKVKENACVVEGIWKYDAVKKSYAKADLGSLEPAAGYWVRVDGPCRITFTGDLSQGIISVPLSPGWNLVGAADKPASIGELKNDCDITAGPWGYASAKYARSSVLKPGEAYWLKVSAECTLSNNAVVAHDVASGVDTTVPLPAKTAGVSASPTPQERAYLPRSSRSSTSSIGEALGRVLKAFTGN